MGLSFDAPFTDVRKILILVQEDFTEGLSAGEMIVVATSFLIAAMSLSLAEVAENEAYSFA